MLANKRVLKVMIVILLITINCMTFGIFPFDEGNIQILINEITLESWFLCLTYLVL